MEASFVQSQTSSRQLIRQLRGRPRVESDDILPENVLWHVFIELQSRGEENASELFIRAVRSLHARRSLAGSTLPCQDGDPAEHRLSDDPMLGDLWRAYKKCICTRRTGPASQLLRDIEEQLGLS